MMLVKLQSNLSGFFKQFSAYRIAVAVSSLSVGFGLIREFLIVALLGFSAANDQLQLYLSIFYAISLSIDSIRLAALNLCGQASLAFILLCTSIFSALFTVTIGYLMNYFAGGLNPLLLWVAILGGFLNLITAMIITYKQRFGAFLGAQLINVLPNFILIPGIIGIYLLARSHAVPLIVSYCCLIPLVQLMLLPFLKTSKKYDTTISRPSLYTGLLIFFRHGMANIGEQIFQLIIRGLFFKLNAGYLSLLAISIRTYAAARFILIDSYIGSKLENWHEQLKGAQMRIFNLLQLDKVRNALLIVSSVWLFLPNSSIYYFALQMAIVMLFGFYYCAQVRIIYFKINRFEHDSRLIIRYGIYEIMFALIGYILIRMLNIPPMFFVWMWFIVKPYVQIIILKPKLSRIEIAV